MANKSTIIKKAPFNPREARALLGTAHSRPAQPPLTQEFKRIRAEVERELLVGTTPDAVIHRQLHDGTWIRFRRWGLSSLCAHHIVYENEE